MDTGVKKIFEFLDIRKYHGFLKYEPASFWHHFKESVVLGSVNWIPGILGAIIRNLVYRIIFSQISGRTLIESNVEFRCVGSIELEGVCLIHKGASINAWSPDSKIRITSSQIDVGVDIRTITGGQIEICESYISSYVFISGPGPIKIGKKCLIAAHVGIYANNHIFSESDRWICEQGYSAKGIVIEDDCWLGTGVKVLDGVTIGRGSVIGAGAVVTKSIPPYSVAVGVPARVIRQRDAVMLK